MITLDNAANSVNIALAEYLCTQGNYEKGLSLYKESLPLLAEKDREPVLEKYRNFALSATTKLARENRWVEVLEIYRDIMRYPGYPSLVVKNTGLCLSVLKVSNAAIDFFKAYKELNPHSIDVDEFIGEVASEQLQDYPLAIEYYEKALAKNPDKATIPSQLAHLYSTFYRDNEKEKQLAYAQRAVDLDPSNRITVKNAAFIYSKFGYIEKADELYDQLMKLNPLHTDLHSYGAYLVRNKRFEKGFKFLRHRFQKEDLNGIVFSQLFYGDKMWDGESSLEGKRVLVHYEQGFGDTIMFSRYLKPLKAICKEVSVIVQGGLVNLFKSSDFGVSVHTEQAIPGLEFDVVIPMMDLPLVLKTTPESIPYPEKFLTVDAAKVKEYGKKYIGNKKKFKVGIAFEGSAHSFQTKRDVPLKHFYDIMRMPNVDVYLLQVDDIRKQIPQVPVDCKYTNLGPTFKNWEDTACAIENMDLIITSDNGVMNLAGALGKKTFGIFNSITEWRWFKTEGDDIAWYKSIKPFKCLADEKWAYPMEKVTAEVKKLAGKLLTVS